MFVTLFMRHVSGRRNPEETVFEQALLAFLSDSDMQFESLIGGRNGVSLVPTAWNVFELLNDLRMI